MSKITDTQLIKHLSHIDELLYSTNDDRKQLLKFCNQIINAIEKQTIKDTNIAELTTKIDGSVSIVFGLHPQQQRFFIGSKSVFNKTPKVNFNIDDIYINHGKSAGLAKTLIYLFEVLSKYKFTNVYQADLIFTPETLDISNGIAKFTPNTITYSLPAELVKGKKVGLSVHTIYRATGDPTDDLSLNHMISSQLLSKPKEIQSAQDVYLVTTKTNIDSILKTDKIRQNFYVKELKNELSKLTSAVNAVNKKNIEELIINLNTFLVSYSNQCIRTGTQHNTQGFIMYMNTKATDANEKLKRARIENFDYVQTEQYATLQSHKTELNTIFGTQESLTKFKTLLLAFFNHGKHEFKTHYKDEETGHEGFVFRFDDKLLKLVDRPRFSKLNFNNDRF